MSSSRSSTIPLIPPSCKYWPVCLTPFDSASVAVPSVAPACFATRSADACASGAIPFTVVPAFVATTAISIGIIIIIININTFAYLYALLSLFEVLAYAGTCCCGGAYPAPLLVFSVQLQ